MTPIKITTILTTHTENGVDKIENKFAGSLTTNATTCTLLYIEDNNITTHCTISPNCVTLGRTGAVETKMEFRLHQTTTTQYKIPEGIIEMGIETSSLEIQQNTTQGNILINYTLIMCGTPVAENQLRILWIR